MAKFAANLSMMFTELPFLERFAAAANAGFQYVEYLWPYDYSKEALKTQLQEHGLKQVLFNTKAGDINAGEWGLAALPGREEDCRKDIDLALEYALALECPQVHIMAGVLPQGADREIYKQTFINNLHYASERFQESGIKILLEALSPAVKANYLLKSQYDTLEIVEACARENIFIQLDYFHAQNVEGNLTRLTEKLIHRVAHIQIASVPDRHEPDEGEINYPYLFETLEKLGYDGYIGCEYKPRASTLEGLSWLKHNPQ